VEEEARRLRQHGYLEKKVVWLKLWYSRLEAQAEFGTRKIQRAFANVDVAKVQFYVVLDIPLCLARPGYPI